MKREIQWGNSGKRRKAKPLTPAEEARRIAEIKGRTPEDVDRDRREVAPDSTSKIAQEARGGDDALEVESVDTVIARALLRAEEKRLERMSLPCFAAMYPDGIEPEDANQKAEDSVGRRACEASNAFEGCTWRYMLGAEAKPVCPRERLIDATERVRQRLNAAAVPKDDYELVFAIVQGKRKSLELDAVKVVREMIRRRKVVLAVENAAEIMTGGRPRKCEVSLRGDERIVVFGGNKGRGKSIAAQLLIAQLGGLYTLEDNYGIPHGDGGVNMDEATNAPGWLVIDQTGGGYKGESQYMRSKVEKVVDVRRSNGAHTLLVGNVTYQTMLQRYGDKHGSEWESMLMDRIHGHGVFIEFGGDSIREHLREAP